MRKRSEPTFETNETAAELRSRSDARRERLEDEENLLMLAEALVRLNGAVLAKLSLAEGILDTVRSAQRISTGAAQNRALRLVRAALRDLDAAELRVRLVSVHGVVVAPAQLRKRDRRR